MRTLFSAAGVFCAACLVQAQTKPTPDTLLFTDGEKLTGQFLKSSGSTLTFKSDALGEVTVDWSKVKEVQTSASVAVIPKGVRIRKPADSANIPKGPLHVEDQQIQLVGQGQTIPLAQTGQIVDQAGFDKAISHQPGILHDWKGAVTIGAAVVNATQDSKSFTGAVNLTRAIPGETWLEPRNRTIINLSAAYGEVTEPGTASIKTAIFHGDAERDEYFSPRLYYFGQGAFDHNFSQGLDLQQTYSAGIGISLIQRANETLDLRGAASYIRQQFQGAPDQDLIGSVFGEAFNRKFKRATFDEHLTLTPAWNKPDDYSAAFNALFTVPVSKRLNGSAGFIDTFHNDPPPGFRKNSMQITMGIPYT